MFLSNLFFEGDLLFIYVDIYRLSSLLNRVIKCFVQCTVYSRKLCSKDFLSVGPDTRVVGD